MRFDKALAVLKTVPSDVSPLLVDRVRAEVYVQPGLDKVRDYPRFVDLMSALRAQWTQFKQLAE